MELIVSFALLGLFMVAASQVISYTVNIYFAAKGINNCAIVSNMVADKVAGMVSSMRETSLDEDSLMGRETSSNTGDELPLIKSGSEILFVDSSNCPVKIGVKDGYLAVTYFNRLDGEGDEVTYKQIPWYFDEKAYMNCTIKDGSFSISPAGGDYPDNIYRLAFTVHSDKYGDYDAVKYIKCCSMPESPSTP